MARIPYMRKVRNRSLERTRHSNVTLEWLHAQALRLVTTVNSVYQRLLLGETAQQVSDTVGTYPSNTVLPTITGSPVVGTQLSTSNGTWIGTGPLTYTYQWLVDNSAIAGATQQTYTPTEGDVGLKVSCRVTATGLLGTASVVTLQTAVVTAE